MIVSPASTPLLSVSTICPAVFTISTSAVPATVVVVVLDFCSGGPFGRVANTVALLTTWAGSASMSDCSTV